MIQNAAARLVFNEPKRAHVTPLFVSLHWLPVAACIQLKTLMLAYRTTTGSAPTYFHSLLRIYIPSRSLRSASERCLVVPSQRGSKSLSRTFSFTVPGRWNDLPTPIRNAGSLSIFKQQLKTHLFQHYLKKKKNVLYFLPFFYIFIYNIYIYIYIYMLQSNSCFNIYIFFSDFIIYINNFTHLKLSNWMIFNSRRVLVI